MSGTQRELPCVVILFEENVVVPRLHSSQASPLDCLIIKHLHKPVRLKKAGLKITGPRTQILQILENSKDNHFSAEEIAQIGKYFGVEKPFIAKSRIIKQIFKTNEAFAKIMKEECVSKCVPHIAKLEHLILQLKDQPFTLTREGQFIVNKNLFGEENGWIQRGIKAQLSDNLAFAKELTLAVAKEVVAQKDKRYQSQQGPVKKMTHMQKRMAQRTLPLATKLKTASFNPKDVLKAIEDRIAASSSPVASTFAPILVQNQRLPAEPTNLSDDAQEWCDAGIPDVGTWYEEADRSISRGHNRPSSSRPTSIGSKDTSPLLSDELDFSYEE